MEQEYGFFLLRCYLDSPKIPALAVEYKQICVRFIAEPSELL